MGSKTGIQPGHVDKLNLQLTILNKARVPADMAAPGWDLHPLRGDLKGHWSVKVNKNWRLTFRFEREDVVLVDNQDYH